MKLLNLGIRRWNIAYKRFRDAKGGFAAVEFAMLALPLMLMIFGCLEMALIILLSVTLDNATDVASRNIRTGITTSANSDVTKFRNTICDNMGWLGATCMNDLKVDVKTYNSFADVPLTDLVSDGKFQTGSFGYDVGGSQAIQLVRVYYQWPLFTPFLEGGLTKLDSGDAVINTKVVFRNEPF
jgi:Flp pilus assembly protein TadG